MVATILCFFFSEVTGEFLVYVLFSWLYSYFIETVFIYHHWSGENYINDCTYPVNGWVNLKMIFNLILEIGYVVDVKIFKLGGPFLSTLGLTNFMYLF